MNTPVLTTNTLTIGYRQPDKVIAADLNLTLTAGRLVCLLGPNGAGKSTLMRTLAGAQPALRGDVMIKGVRLGVLPPQARAAQISVVLTERPSLGLMNGYALVSLGRYPYTGWTGRLSHHDEAVVRWAVESVGAVEFASHPVSQLSDGQRQKLMIARALAQEADIILLDEPTAYLDLPRRAEIMHLLRQIARHTGRAILLSTHDLDLALRSADMLWLMAEGCIREGAPEDLVLNGAFEAAFTGAGVEFDRANGTFSMTDRAGVTVGVRGEGIPRIWTERALKRAGFQVVGEQETAAHHVTVNGTEQSPRWFIDSNHTPYLSIADMLAALTAQAFPASA